MDTFDVAATFFSSGVFFFLSYNSRSNPFRYPLFHSHSARSRDTSTQSCWQFSQGQVSSRRCLQHRFLDFYSRWKLRKYRSNDSGEAIFKKRLRFLINFLQPVKIGDNFVKRMRKIKLDLCSPKGEKPIFNF